MKVVDYNSVDPKEWNRFVEGHPQGTVFQTAEMCEVYALAANHLPFALAVEDCGAVKGVLLADVVSNGGKLMRAMTARSIINGGPLAKDNDEEVLKLLLDEYRRRLPWYVVYSEIRPVYDMKPVEVALKSCGFERIGHYNILLDLKKDENSLWEQMHKERRRNINHAMKMGLEFKEVTSDEEVSRILKLIEKTYSRKRVPFSGHELIALLSQKMKQYVRFFAAYYEEKMIAGQVRLCYGDLVYAWYAGSDEEFFKLRPNDFLMWNVIRWAHEEGFSIFDFGGGGEPGVPYGVRDYKLKYGGELHEYGRFLEKHRPLTYGLGCLYAKTRIKR